MKHQELQGMFNRYLNGHSSQDEIRLIENWYANVSGRLPFDSEFDSDTTQQKLWEKIMDNIIQQIEKKDNMKNDSPFLDL